MAPTTTESRPNAKERPGRTANRNMRCGHEGRIEGHPAALACIENQQRTIFGWNNMSNQLELARSCATSFD
jgi:hypothetical protein